MPGYARADLPRPAVSLKTRKSRMARAASNKRQNAALPTSPEGDQAREGALEEGKVFDYITGEPIKHSEKERVRQRIARAIIHEYGIAAEDMEPDFRVKVGGKNRKVDIAIFRPGKPHEIENLYRVVVVEKEPTVGAKSAYRMRDPDEAS